MIHAKSVLAVLVFLGLYLACGAASAQSDGIIIHHSWEGNPRTLNVRITGAPPESAIEVTVEQLPDHQIEDPNGVPPDKTDESGNWPGEEAGGDVGYPGTAEDPAGTKYVIKVRINDQTGPVKGVTKPRSFIKSLIGWVSFGLLCSSREVGTDSACVSAGPSALSPFPSESP